MHSLSRIIAALLLLLVFGCGDGDDTPAAQSEQTALSGADNPFALTGLNAVTAEGAAIGRLEKLLVDEDQGIYVLLSPAEAGAKRRVIPVEDLRIQGGKAVLAEGTALSDLAVYDTASHHPFGYRVEP